MVDIVLRIEHAFRLSDCDTESNPVATTRAVRNIVGVDTVVFEPGFNSFMRVGMGNYEGFCLGLGQMFTVPYKIYKYDARMGT
jgi:hypothetical protein